MLDFLQHSSDEGRQPKFPDIYQNADWERHQRVNKIENKTKI